MNPPAVEAVLYDWDGTIVDSAEASFLCYEELFASYGLRFDRETYAATYSPNWHRTYVAVGLPEDRWAEADARWVEGYRRRTIPLLGGAREAIERVSAAGLAQGLVTSGDRGRVERELSAHGIAAHFRAVVCGSDPVRKKPHPEALLVALQGLGVPPGRAAYVGDSPEDVEMARVAGVWSIGIPGGFPNRPALERARPDLLAERLADAIEALIGAARTGTSR
jgi:HAD superfamily hydrolase (TIGR01509 family)